MSYVYMYVCGAPYKVSNFNVVYIYIYGPTFGKVESRLFYLLHSVSTLNQCRK
jgi:hypothetical protein